jgi:hypothetical protein
MAVGAVNSLRIPINGCGHENLVIETRKETQGRLFVKRLDLAAGQAVCRKYIVVRIAIVLSLQSDDTVANNLKQFALNLNLICARRRAVTDPTFIEITGRQIVCTIDQYAGIPVDLLWLYGEDGPGFDPGHELCMLSRAITLPEFVPIFGEIYDSIDTTDIANVMT